MRPVLALLPDVSRAERDKARKKQKTDLSPFFLINLAEAVSAYVWLYRIPVSPINNEASNRETAQ